MANEIKTPRFTKEQRMAWTQAKQHIAAGYLSPLSAASRRALHIAMSELRAENGRKHRGPIEAEPKNEAKRIQHAAVRAGLRINDRVAEWKRYLKDPGAKKLFIIVRPDLSQAQKAVQAAHCAAKFQEEHRPAPWINGTLILLEPNVKDSWWSRMASAVTPSKRATQFEQFAERWWQYPFQTMWREPDLNNELTAFALLSDFENDRISSSESIKLL